MVDGVDITQRMLTLDAGRPVRDLRVIFTDQRNALSYQVVDPHGASTTEYVAIVFPTRSGEGESRRLELTRADRAAF